MHKIALIDDHQDTRDLLALFLSFDPELAVTSFANANAALDGIKAGMTFDLIISDISMPGMDGIEFGRVVREELHLLDIPLIAVSAHAADQYVRAARLVGFDEYLIKPVDLTDLLNCVRNLLLPRTSRRKDLRGDAQPTGVRSHIGPLL